MIKFFRNIRQKLLSEGDMGKYFKYAIGEILLVMIGILLALQVNNWNEIRKDRIKETKYLERLREDLTSDLKEFELNYQFYEQVSDYGNLSLSYVNGEDLGETSNWEVLIAFFHASQIWPVIPTMSTYEELKSSGELSLIQSADLINDLSHYHGGALYRYNSTVAIQPPYRKLVRELIPAKVQDYLWDNCHVTLNDAQILKNCDPFLNEEESKKILDRLRNDAVLIKELRYFMSSIKAGMPKITIQINLCKNMIEDIDKIRSSSSK